MTIKELVTAALLVTGFQFAGVQTAQAQSVVEIPYYQQNLGEVAIGSQTPVYFEITSNWNLPFVISRILPTSPELQVGSYPMMLQPGEMGEIELIFAPRGPGFKQKSVRILNNAGEEIYLSVMANVR